MRVHRRSALQSRRARGADIGCPTGTFASQASLCDDADEVGTAERAHDPPQVEVHDAFLLNDAEVLDRRAVRGLGKKE